MQLVWGLFKSPGFIIGFALFALTLLFAWLAPFVMHIDTQTRVGLAYMPPSSQHWLGTDHLGLDMVSLLVEGLRASLYVGFLAGIVATLVGTLIGVYGGFKGGLLDDVLTATTNLFLVIPSLILLILLSASLDEGRSLTLILSQKRPM
jgi:peptide/nickel transport system permease protein